MNFPPPRPFQVTAHERLRQGIRDGFRRQMLMSPTGSGKTYLGMRLAHEALERNRRVIFVCDRTTLINQTSETADRYGLSDHGVIQASHWRFRPHAQFQIASAQTLARRQWPEADVIIVDEAHTQLTTVTEHIQKTKAVVIGLSATPFSAGLGKLYPNLVNATTMHELTQSGVLVPMVPYTCTPMDMRGAATAGGEWTEEAAAERGMDIVGDVVAEWIKLGENRKTIVFGSNIKHCEELCRQFSDVNVMAALFTSHTTDTERKSLLDEYRKPDSNLRVLISVEALAKGFDVPDVGCVVDCRPLRKSLSTAIQMWGRGLRSSPETGKKDCILLDHTGNILRFADDYTNIFFHGLESLDMGEKLDKTIRRDEEQREAKACPKCKRIPFTNQCMSCGFQIAPKSDLESLPGQMEPVMLGKKKLADDKLHLYEQVVNYARAYSKPEKQFWRAHYLFKDMTGQAPPKDFERLFQSIPEVPVTRNVINKIRSSNIRFAKGAARAV